MPDMWFSGVRHFLFIRDLREELPSVHRIVHIQRARSQIEMLIDGKELGASGMMTNHDWAVLLLCDADDHPICCRAHVKKLGRVGLGFRHDVPSAVKGSIVFSVAKPSAPAVTNA